jgi:K+-sensing histidine kinase KdpD
MVATAACGILPFLIVRVASSVQQMQRDEVAVRTGLSVPTAILRAHGGAIAAHPRDGGGTELVVELPRHRSQPAVEAHA